MGYQNPVDALQWVGEVATGEIYDRVVPALIKQIAQKSPLAAADSIDQLHSGTVRQEAISWVTSTWASQDLEAALDWIDSIQEIDDYSATLRSFSQLWIKLDLESMIEFARNLEPGKLQSDFLRTDCKPALPRKSGSSSLLAQDIDPDSPSRQHSMRTVFSYLANENPTRAARYIEDLDDLNLTRMLADTDTVAVIWGKNNPIETVQWAEELPSERGGREAITVVPAPGCITTPQRIRVIDKIPNRETRDAAVRQLVRSIQREDPEAAFLWAETVSNPSIRLDLLEYSLRQWSKRDPDAAEDSIWEISLTQDERNRLLARVGRSSTGIK